jgi:hypothetical protein
VPARRKTGAPVSRRHGERRLTIHAFVWKDRRRGFRQYDGDPDASVTTSAISGMYEKVVNIDVAELSGQADKLVRHPRPVARQRHTTIGMAPAG